MTMKQAMWELHFAWKRLLSEVKSLIIPVSTNEVEWQTMIKESVARHLEKERHRRPWE